LRFAAESCETFGIAGERVGQDFERDVASEFRILRAIHLAHEEEYEQFDQDWDEFCSRENTEVEK